MSLLKVKGLSVEYGTGNGIQRGIKDITFSMTQEDSLGFVGESGCGKTTLGMALMGLLPENAAITKGSICFNGSDITNFNEAQWKNFRGREISMVFQAAMNALNPVIRVDEQIMEAVRAHNPHMSRAEIYDKTFKLFNMVKIPGERRKDYPHQYSGGMKQRAVIAMALACDPKLIIADEPTTALDVIVQDQIIKKIKEIKNSGSTAVIFISHDIAVVASICRDICVMYQGRIVEQGNCIKVLNNPEHPYTKSLVSSYLTLNSSGQAAGQEKND